MNRTALRGTRCLLACVAAFGTLAACAASSSDRAEAESGFNAKLGYDTSLGKFGQDSNTVVNVTSLTVTYDTDDYSFDLVAPYVDQSGPGRLISIPGRRPIVIAGPRQTASGRGDVTAGITRYLLNEEDHGIDLDLGAIAKFGTASVDKNLGTGKNDISIQATAARSYEKFNGTLTVGYTFVGKPPNQGFRNASYGSLDGSYKVDDAVSIGLTFSIGGTVVNGLQGTRDITANVDFKPAKRVKVEVYVLMGLSTQSPDKGGGVTVAYDF